MLTFGVDALGHLTFNHLLVNSCFFFHKPLNLCLNTFIQAFGVLIRVSLIFCPSHKSYGDFWQLLEICTATFPYLARAIDANLSKIG